MGDKIKVQQLDRGAEEQLISLFKGKAKYARFGETRYILPVHYENEVDNFKNMTVRPDDVFVATGPRSGTTLTQELVWLLKNDLNYETALKIPLVNRYMFIGIGKLPVPDDPLYQVQLTSYEAITNAPAPRFIKTHLPFSLLPANLLDTTKVVYVARDPRDVAVSRYHFSKIVNSYAGDFKTYWNLFINDLVLFTPYFPHVKEAWALRHHPNLMFIFYEEMSKDLSSSIKRIANFLGKEVSEEQIAKLCEHLDIENFKKNVSVTRYSLQNDEGLVRRGKVGGWREYFDAEMAAQAQAWLRMNLAGTDLRFPDDS